MFAKVVSILDLDALTMSERHDVVQAIIAHDKQTSRDALAEAVRVCREFSKGYDMEWWRETPKTEVYKTACLEMIAQLDRLREGVKG